MQTTHIHLSTLLLFTKVASGLIVCLAATWVGGTFIIGTAETVYDPKMGLVWAVMPIAATVAFTLGKTGVRVAVHLPAAVGWHTFALST